LNNDGNLLDAFNFAAIIALHRYRLPFVSVERGKLKVWSFEEKRPQTLSVHHWPIIMTFGIMNENSETDNGIDEYVLYDPTVIGVFDWFLES
jgi:exosome complex component RRP45